MKSARVVFRVARGVEVRVSRGISRLFGSCPVRRTALLSTFHSLACCVLIRISGQFLWSSGAPMLARCMASCDAGVSRRAGSPKHWGFECPSLPTLPEPGMMVIGTLFGLGGLVAKRRLKK